MLPTALLLTFLAAGQVASSDTALNINIDLELTAVTTSGTYTGFVDDAAPNVKQWLGIRYGKAPVGRKRFMPPEPSVDMTTHYYAREYKPICFQQSGNHTGLFWELVPEFQNQDPQSEDCLYLNVWAPKKPAKKVPVLIWVCGSGLQEGVYRVVAYRFFRFIALFTIILARENIVRLFLLTFTIFSNSLSKALCFSLSLSLPAFPGNNIFLRSHFVQFYKGNLDLQTVYS
ncbi:hypothetical protein HBI67_240160 [Parastagonospora nodorum]|nr:hypothetical protein HBI67_240160 [Parastagonospora nodorum]KAH6052723.1 hypothetical protein HBI66_236140 [Parastagonospora nodorum]